MSNSQSYRAGRWIEGAVLCLSLLFLCGHTLPRAWKTLNTDFPNYYMSARLVHEGYDTSRMYEWAWIEREKDHRAVDIRVIGLLPITPFSTLAVWPFVWLSPLAAKHAWILLNLAFLIPIAWMLRAMSGLGYRRIALAIALSFPLHRNLLFGQFYVLLLLLIVAACWSYLRGFRALAGALLAIAGACKVFPALLFIFFLQRRDWRALISGVVTGLAATAVSVYIFGWNVHRTWFHEILPWTLRGEGLQPYVPTASISGVLHLLFLSEPQWNPNPWHASPLCYALLLPMLQMFTLAPAILVVRKADRTRRRILLEWSAILTASLAISTIPASYNFVLMIFPACILAAELLERKRHGWLAALVVAYLGIGFPMPGPHRTMGPALLLYLPRLPLMLAVLLGNYVLLWRDRPARDTVRDWTRYVWAVAMVASVLISIPSTLRVERAMRQEFAYRLPVGTQGYANSDPQSANGGVRYTAFTLNGYHLVSRDRDGIESDPSGDSLYGESPYDDLSFTSGPGHTWVERALSPHSQIIDIQQPARVIVDDAHEPMLSVDGHSLAFVRDHHGRGQLLVRRGFQPDAASDVASNTASNAPTNAMPDAPLTPPAFDVYEASFHSNSEFAFSAVTDGKPPQIYLTDATHANAPLALGESRYPALSPDGRWMAYSRLDHGVWNLWLRDQASGAIQRIADVPCNQIQPSWDADSRELLYSTDCGRSVWFTALARRTVIP